MIVGLSGYAQAGKDTVAGILVRERGFRQVAFADALRQLAYSCNHDFKDAVLSQGYEKAKTNPAYRRFLQDLGNGARKHLGSDVWVSAVFNKINAALAERGGQLDWVISDVRYPNEVEAVRAHCGQVWRIERPGTGPVNGHISETAIDRYAFDQVIANDGTLEKLHDEVLELHKLLNPDYGYVG